MNNTIKIALVLFVLIHVVFPVQGQNYIGMHKDQIADALRENNPDFRLDNTTVNQVYKYLKFVDNVSEQTMLFFLSENDICTYVRWISDYANLNDIMTALNSKYTKNKDKSWAYTENGKRYSVKLEEDEWYFTVNIQEE